MSTNAADAASSPIPRSGRILKTIAFAIVGGLLGAVLTLLADEIRAYF